MADATTNKRRQTEIEMSRRGKITNGPENRVIRGKVDLTGN